MRKGKSIHKIIPHSAIPLSIADLFSPFQAFSFGLSAYSLYLHVGYFSILSSTFFQTQTVNG